MIDFYRCERCGEVWTTVLGKPGKRQTERET
jgi:hypothetical protein